MIAAILTPPDVLSQLSLAIPLMMLYEASIYSVRMVEKKAQARRRGGRQAGGQPGGVTAWVRRRACRKRRYVIVGAFVIAAILTPPDVLSQLALALPLLALYEAASRSCGG